MNKIIVFTTHVHNSKRKAGFHWIADAFYRRGWDVTFVTCISYIETSRGDYRVEYIDKSKYNKLEKVRDRFTSYVMFNLVRPFAVSPLVDKLTQYVFTLYGKTGFGELTERLAAADLIILESIYEIMYFEKIRKINPTAKIVYRVSDDMDVVNVHKVCRDYERKISPKFDLVSCPTEMIFKKFDRLENSAIHKHGVPVHLYDEPCSNPYPENSINAVFIGTSAFDFEFLEVASKNFPRVSFHVIGPIEKRFSAPNIIYYGEMAYVDTIPYVKHANIGLSPRTLVGLGESNKIQQYEYCKLPIVMSSISESNNKRIIFYKIGSEASVIEAMHAALEWVPSDSISSSVRSWDDLLDDILSSIDAVTSPLVELQS
ncbi:hypothetical protein [Variovorax sp. W2I14]|uniref:GumK N-terminal domain-containing glycosyltransferase n=1 Tax=Variovorax sp. W2I14 TaxID=3042290 RepID=UPI003D21AA4F